MFLVPVLGKLIGEDFDKWGFTVCSVSGTNFVPYIKFLGPKGLNVPFAVLTDLDPQDEGRGLGEERVLNLLSEIMDKEEFERRNATELLRLAPQEGFFLNDYTFEVDLFRCGRHKSICRTLIELSDNKAARKRAEGWMETPAGLDVERFLDDITAIGKGRFAQRLATRIKGNKCPSYIKDAIQYVVSRCR
jgi:putative ATP-dependent endonuclease of OLD family